jgi:hypothetical protein
MENNLMETEEAIHILGAAIERGSLSGDSAKAAIALMRVAREAETDPISEAVDAFVNKNVLKAAQSLASSGN